MIENTVFDISNLDNTAQITKIDSDEEEEFTAETKLLPTSEVSQNKENSSQLPHLPMPDPTEITFPPSPDYSRLSSELSESGTSTLDAIIALPPQNIAPRAGEISSAFDTANILPEGKGRTRTR